MFENNKLFAGHSKWVCGADKPRGGADLGAMLLIDVVGKRSLGFMRWLALAGSRYLVLLC